MALKLDNAVAEAMEQEVVRRYELRGIHKKVAAADRRRMAAVADSIKGFAPKAPLGVMRAFMDYAFPVGGKSFKNVRNMFFEWREWSEEVYPTISHLFPITDQDEDAMSRFFSDWRELRKGLAYFKDVYRSPSTIGGAKMEPAYRYTRDFFRVLVVLRHYQGIAEEYPLFSLRAYLAAQIEALSNWVPRIQIGNIVSEKAMGRFDEWYMYRFYNLELVKKGLKRPSDNNPVSNPGVRVEYESKLLDARRGDFAFPDEVPVPWATMPGKPVVKEGVLKSEPEAAAVKLPPGMSTLLDG